ncbi:hypothetical protein [Devosia sp. Naph2]|uniref:hypothetical protein n=1 Tax=Devosia polycyclovorans TaxID=3345148 RepID=UPI0035CF6A18
MNLDGANTEAFLRYHRFHERFSGSVRLQTMGLSLLADEVESGRSADELYERFSKRGWLWGGMPDWREPMQLIAGARREIGQAGVVRAFSAFDVFFSDLEADLERWRVFRGNKKPGDDAADLDEEGFADPAKVLYRRVGGRTSGFDDFLLPLYQYFRRARNCIAHRDGIASAALVSDSSSEGIVASLKAWRSRTGEMTQPELIPVQVGTPIEFTHKQAIACSSILRLVAKDISSHAVQRLGRAGMVYLAARRLLWEELPLIDLSVHNSASAAVGHLLDTRYRAGGFEQHEIQRSLRELGFTTECNKRFQRLRERLPTEGSSKHLSDA